MKSSEQVIKSLYEWVENSGRPQVYLFGSLLTPRYYHSDSDVDLILVFPNDCSNAESRTGYLRQFETHIKNVELLMLENKLSHSSDPQCSCVAVTQMEVDENIHKGGTLDFFECNNFLDLRSSKNHAIPLTAHKGNPDNLFDLRKAIESVQSFRNKFLKCCIPAGFSYKGWEGVSLLPKDLMRESAIVQSIVSLSKKSTNLTDGLQFIWQILFETKNNYSMSGELFSLISNRALGLGTPPRLERHHVLFLWELLFDVIKQARNIDATPSSRSGEHEAADPTDKKRQANEYQSRAKKEDIANLEGWHRFVSSLFRGGIPSEYVWKNINDIENVLSKIGASKVLNHMFMPDYGGADLIGAKLSLVAGFLEIHCQGSVLLVKPAELVFQAIPNASPDWCYFYLEASTIEAISPEGKSSEHKNEILLEIAPGKYIGPEYAGQDHYYDSGGLEKPMTQEARLINRFKKGYFAIFAKRSLYNKNASSYEGIHDKLGKVGFYNLAQRHASMQESQHSIASVVIINNEIHEKTLDNTESVKNKETTINEIFITSKKVERHLHKTSFNLNNPRKENFVDLVWNCDDMEYNHTLWVNTQGDVFIEPRVNAGEFSDRSDFQFQLETFCCGNGYVGPSAARDDKYIDEMFAVLVRLWKEGAHGYIESW